MSARTVAFAQEGQRLREVERAAGLYQVKEEDWWYAIGFAAADGCLDKLPSGTTRVHLLSTDRQILDDMKTALNIPTVVRFQDMKRERSKVCYRLSYANRTFAERFLTAGLTPAKSTTMRGLRVDEQYINHFLRGYCDGDGHIQPGVNGIQVSFVGGSEEYMLWLKGVVSRFGPWRIREYKRTDRKGHWWTVAASSEAALPFVKQVYGTEGLVLGRKLDLVKRFI